MRNHAVQQHQLNYNSNRIKALLAEVQKHNISEFVSEVVRTFLANINLSQI